MSRVVHEVVEEALRELADESMQRELWLSDGTADVSSLTESVSRLLDDSGLGDALDSTQVVYDPDIDARLRQLGDALVEIDGERSPEAILGDPKLQRVRELAAALLLEMRRRPGW